MASAPIHVGPYEILSRLGAGGMAETFVAVRRGPGDFEQRVCLKRIRGELDRDAEFVRQFLSEAKLAATLRHANVAQVLDFGRDGEGYYLALELVDGVDLRELIDASPGGLGARWTLHVAIEVATALDFAHRGATPDGGAGIVHRDISPSNVLVSREGEVKLADFGIARPLEGPKHTRTGIIKGKVPYMAPEYARTAVFDVRCDLFSLGVTLHECLTGLRPYDGTTDVETFERAARGERMPLRALAPDAPAELVTVIERLIAPAPNARFPTAATLLDALLPMATDGGARRELAARIREIHAARAVTTRAARASSPAAFAQTEQSDLGNAVPTRTAALDEPAPGREARRGLGPWIALATACTAAAVVMLIARERAAAPRAAEAVPYADTPAVTVSGPPSPRPAIDRTWPPAPPHASPVVQPGESVPTEGAGPPSAEAGDHAPPAASPSPSAAIGDPALPAAPPTPTAETGDHAPPAAPAPPRAASVRVVVVPFGDVAIDGRPVGPSPAEVRLAPGEHVAVTNGPGGSRTRRFNVRAGQRLQITIE